MIDAEKLKEIYKLRAHVEGGSFREIYTAPFNSDGRPMAGSIYFLLDGRELSHFHEIDCDELWFYHAGCGLRLILLDKRGRREILLGPEPEKGQRVLAVIPAGTVFAAENLESDAFTLAQILRLARRDRDARNLVYRHGIAEPEGDIVRALQ